MHSSVSSKKPNKHHREHPKTGEIWKVLASPSSSVSEMIIIIDFHSVNYDYYDEFVELSVFREKVGFADITFFFSEIIKVE